MTRNVGKLWRWIGIAVGLVGLAGILWTAAIWNQYLTMLPRQPAPEMGNIYPLNIHGIIVYQTQQERDRRERIQYSSIGLFAVSALMAAMRETKWGHYLRA